MTRTEFEQQRWGAGMVVKYTDVKKDSHTVLTADVISVDFESYTIGVELPIVKDLVFLPCEKCTLLVDFSKK